MSRARSSVFNPPSSAPATTSVVALVPFLGYVLSRVGLLVFGVAILYGIYSALSGKMARIPKVSDLADKIVI